MAFKNVAHRNPNYYFFAGAKFLILGGNSEDGFHLETEIIDLVLILPSFLILFDIFIEIFNFFSRMILRTPASTRRPFLRQDDPGRRRS